MPTKKNLTAELPNDKTLIEGYALGVAVDKTGDTMTGNLEAPSLSVGGSKISPFGFKNKLINGALNIWQRGTSFPTAGYQYVADRFSMYSDVAHAISRVAGTGDFEYALRYEGTALTTQSQLWQTIESANSYSLVGKKVTFSGKFYSDAVRNIDIKLSTLDAKDVSIPNTIQQSHTVALAIGWNDIAYMFPTVLPASAVNGVQILAEYGALTSGYIDTTGWQLEEGEIATPFEQRPIGLEEMLCKRYYQSIGIPAYSQQGIVRATASGYGTSERRVLPVEMRAVPTISGSVATCSAYTVINAQGTVSLSNVTITGVSVTPQTWQIRADQATFSNGAAYNIYTNVDALVLELNAEL